MPEGYRECPYCGEKIKARAEKCRFCGEFIIREDKGGLTTGDIVGIIISSICVILIIMILIDPEIIYESIDLFHNVYGI